MKKGGKTSFSAPRGMRDFYPDEMRTRRRLFDAWHRAAAQAGFEEYDACVVETLDLLKRKSGEEIVDQIYHFEDKSGRELALRPEMTPSLARMVTARQGSLALPLKWYTVAQCFRYERMSRGRKREHYQWNLDVIGEESVTAEAEILATAVAALRSLGLKQDQVHVLYSNRALLADLLRRAGLAEEHHAATFLALDKRGKLPDELIKTMLEEAGLPANAVDGVFDLLQIETLRQVGEMLGEDTAAYRETVALRELLKGYGIADMVKFDISIIRGLAYYTGVVFEAFDTAGRFRAIFGGGRYDNLLGDVGGKPTTGVGLGFGDVVIAELLADNHNSILTDTLPQGTSIGYMELAQRGAAVALAAHLRRDGECAELALRPEKAKAFFARSSKAGREKAVYLGPDDVARGTCRVKNLATRDQLELPLAAD